jgi:hypothetical protein
MTSFQCISNIDQVFDHFFRERPIDIDVRKRDFRRHPIRIDRPLCQIQGQDERQLGED